MQDPTGALITELRNANIASGRVRGGEPAPGDASKPYQRFVVLSRLGAVREHRAPVQEVRIGVRAYAPTPQDAAALYGEISDAVDNVGPRLVGTRVIYQSLDDTGGSASKDPLTGQPYEDGVIALYAGTEVSGS